MQHLSYEFQEPRFDLGGWQVSLRLVTFDNLYGLDPDRTTLRAAHDGWEAVAEGLTWAGGQERSPGWARLQAKPTPDGLELVVEARHPAKLRCAKLHLWDVPAGAVLGAGWEEQAVPPEGLLLAYPGWPGNLHTPLVFLRLDDGSYRYFRSLDDRVRAKRLAFTPTPGGLAVELIHEEAGPAMGNVLHGPPWRVGRTRTPEAIVREHRDHVERAYGLRPWEDRPDVPDWARQISLVVALHGMHWTGYAFNTYDDMLAALQWVTQRIEGRRVLAYLPGWEGRYYWQYGDYRPEPRLGGPQGFRRLVEGAHTLGVHLMPMFGANCANAGLEGFDRWGAPSLLRSASGLVFQGNRPDWDTSRAHDPGWQAWLNPGAPAWQERLCQQIADVVDVYGLAEDAVFLDTQDTWENDPRHPVYEGLVALRDTLKARFPGLLVAGEGWYDALGAVTPICHYRDPVRWTWFFDRHCRAFSHLST